MAKPKLPAPAKVHALLAHGLEWVWPAGAAWAYSDALRRAPDSAELHFLLGRALERGQRWCEAAGAFESATAREPTSVEYQGALVVALHHARREMELVSALRRLAQLRPGQGEVHLLIGAVLRRCGRKAEALRAFRLGVRLPPGPSARRFLLGEILLGREGWEDTVSAWQQAQRIEEGAARRAASAPGQSALNFHPGREREPSRGKTRSRRRRGRVLDALRRRCLSVRDSWRGLLDRGARAITLEQRVRALRRAWQKAHLRPLRRPARGRAA